MPILNKQTWLQRCQNCDKKDVKIKVSTRRSYNFGQNSKPIQRIKKVTVTCLWSRCGHVSIYRPKGWYV